MSTYKELQDDVLDRLNFDNSTTSSGPRTRIKRYLNEWYRRILAAPGMSRVRQSPTTITLVAGTANYTIAASGIREIYDATNDVRLEERTLEWLRERDPGSDATGNPIFYVVRSRALTISVTLWPVPAASGTLNVDAEASVTVMSADGDFPSMPIDFHYLLGEGAMYNEYMRMGDIARAQLTISTIRAGQSALRSYIYSTGAARLVPGRSRNQPERSRLGSNYPSDW